MINWFDMPAEGLSNGGLFEVKELEVTENGTYETKGEMYNKVTVNVEGGGGSWQTVFEGSVTTEPIEDTSLFGITLSDDLRFNQDIIRVTLNGVEYECEKIIMDGNMGCAYGDYTGEGSEPDFSQYPFALVSVPLSPNDTDNTFLTQTAGTYTLKIEEPQSGGSSDFSTAEVTVQVTGDASNSIFFTDWVTIREESEQRYITVDESFGVAPNNSPQQFTVILLDGVYGGAINYTGNITVSDNAELLEGSILIHGDCTITIS